MSNPARLGRLYSIAQIARKVGWSCDKAHEQWRESSCRCKACRAGIERMRRHLVTQNEQMHGMLLVDTSRQNGKRRSGSGGYVLTLQALEQLHPQWFVSAEGLAEQVAALADKLEDQEMAYDETLRALRAVGERVAQLESHLRGSMVQAH